MSFESPLTNEKRVVVYADCTGSGEKDTQIEQLLLTHVLPYYANTHSDGFCANTMTVMIERSHTCIKKECLPRPENVHNDYAVIFTGQGMTGATRHLAYLLSPVPVKTIVYSVLEHLSNSALWETVFPDANVYVIDVDETDSSLIDTEDVERHLNTIINTLSKQKEIEVHTILVAITACSNVLGCIQPVKRICCLINTYRTAVSEYGTRIVTCLDCAACAPYFPLGPMFRDMDAMTLSPHKFKGGQSTPGVLIVKKELIDPTLPPFYPGGGTVWYKDKARCNNFVPSIEHREEGGSPNIIGIIRTGLLFERKQYHQHDILVRTRYLVKEIDDFFLKRPDILNVIDMFAALGKHQDRRLPIYSFRVHGVHPGLFVKVLSDRYGIQTRSGVACCYLLAENLCQINKNERKKILNNKGTPKKYGWVRVSFYYGNSDAHINTVLHCIEHLIPTIRRYENEYTYCCEQNAWYHKIHDVKQNAVHEQVENTFHSVQSSSSVF